MTSKKKPTVQKKAASTPEPVVDFTQKPPFPIVAIGASAGGLAAFEAFFSGMPSDRDPDMAFVLVQHLAPDHKSMLIALIQRHTRMPVAEVEDGVVVQPNCVYIIPPNHNLSILNGALQLLEPTAERGLRLPIDYFLRALAQDQHERAFGIILSGTGSDGVLGLREIKGEGGVVLVQTPESAEYDGMPRSAIDTGLVDYILSPAEMPARLIACSAHPPVKPTLLTKLTLPKSENLLQKIFVLLRTQTGHDFSQYKRNTIERRIERRMTVQQIQNLDNYVKYLQKSPEEVEALFRDLLIGVTSFFRDPEAFAALEQIGLPKLFSKKPDGAPLRVWSVGCSTGEEAYSIAILLTEQMAALKKNYALQIFATDIDRQAITTARAGRYPANIVADLSPERLARFFTAVPEGGGYRVKKSIRDLLIFSEQDVIKDPPFSKIDLIVCRNLLIYLDGDLQKKVMPLFHYALNPGGFLFLGTSESKGEFEYHFAALDRNAKLFQRKEDLYGAQRVAFSQVLSPTTTLATQQPLHIASKALPRPTKIHLRELTEQTLLQQIKTSAALINSKGDILFLHGRTGQYLEPAPGESQINNILMMAREGLGAGLATALRKTVVQKERVDVHALNVKTNGHYTRVNLSICPVPATNGETDASTLYLVILQEVEMPGDVKPTTLTDIDLQQTHSDAHFKALKRELRAREEDLQTANQGLEATNEELQSSNEEMQSMNEELQSSNEELMTSQEELQSVNEELFTVNAELQTMVADLSRSNNDMNNLLAGTGVGTVFVDHQLCILRFTPAVTEIINLAQSDIGRPLGHFTANLIGYDRLTADIKTVLDTLATKIEIVQTKGGKWHTLNITPYRTLSNVIEGAVISFVDVTELKQAHIDILELKKAHAALQKSNDLNRLAVVVRDSLDAIILQDMEGQILAWNPAASRMYGWSESEALKLNIKVLIPEELAGEQLKQVQQLSNKKVLKPYHTQRLTKKGGRIEVQMTATALLNDKRKIYGIATTERARENREG